MSDYVKREDALKASTPLFTNPFSDWEAGWIEGKESTRDAIEDLPAEDVVEVVRCKDCFMKKHGCKAAIVYGDNGYCSIGDREGTLAKNAIVEDDRICGNCKHDEEGWDSEACDSCTVDRSNWERRDDGNC